MNTGEQSLFERDRAFCELATKKGHLGWKAYMAEDVIIGTALHNPYVQGREQIIPLLENTYKLEALEFTWEPQFAFCSADETLGVTTGTSTRTYIVNGEQKKDIGKYMTTWKKIDGEWYVIFDMGN